MKQWDIRTNETLKKLVEMGTKGHFPLFESSIFAFLNPRQNEKTAVDPTESKRAKDIINRLVKHRTIERQKIVIFSLPLEDQIILLKAFLKLVEGKILDDKFSLQ